MRGGPLDESGPLRASGRRAESRRRAEYRPISAKLPILEVNQVAAMVRDEIGGSPAWLRNHNPPVNAESVRLDGRQLPSGETLGELLPVSHSGVLRAAPTRSSGMAGPPA